MPRPSNKDKRPKPVVTDPSVTWNKDAKMIIPKKDPIGTQYRCTCCGEYYPTQTTYFYPSKSPLFSGNNGFYPVCKSCISAYYDFILKKYNGDPRKAVERLCQITDVYFNDDIYDKMNDADFIGNIYNMYLSKTKLKAFAGLGETYMDTIRDKANAPIREIVKPSGIDAIEDEKEEFSATPEQIEHWGLDFTLEEYDFLDLHYKTLKARAPEDDPMRDVYINDMCVTKVFQNRALASNDADKFIKLQQSYQVTAKNANLRPVGTGEDIDASEQTFGKFIEQIEQKTPAEFYKDKHLFDDYDSIKEYIDRFIVRPFKNFFTGSSEMDPEYSINVDGTDNMSNIGGDSDESE